MRSLYFIHLLYHCYTSNVRLLAVFDVHYAVYIYAFDEERLPKSCPNCLVTTDPGSYYSTDAMPNTKVLADTQYYISLNGIRCKKRFYEEAQNIPADHIVS